MALQFADSASPPADPSPLVPAYLFDLQRQGRGQECAAALAALPGPRQSVYWRNGLVPGAGWVAGRCGVCRAVGVCARVGVWCSLQTCVQGQRAVERLSTHKHTCRLANPGVKHECKL